MTGVSRKEAFSDTQQPMNSEWHIDRAPHERSTPSPVTDRLARFALLLALGALTWTGLLQIQAPTPRPETAPAVAFSAARAMAHLRVLASESRAVGTPGHTAARAYLIDHIREMGLQPVVQEAPSHEIGRAHV